MMTKIKRWIYVEERLPMYGEVVRMTDGKDIFWGFRQLDNRIYSVANIIHGEIIAWLSEPHNAPPMPTVAQHNEWLRNKESE